MHNTVGAPHTELNSHTPSNFDFLLNDVMAAEGVATPAGSNRKLQAGEWASIK